MKRKYDEAGLPSGANLSRWHLNLVVMAVAFPLLWLAFGKYVPNVVNAAQEGGLFPIFHDGKVYVGVTFEDEPDALHLQELSTWWSHSYCRTEVPIDRFTNEPDPIFGDHQYETREGDCDEGWIAGQ